MKKILLLELMALLVVFTSCSDSTAPGTGPIKEEYVTVKDSIHDEGGKIIYTLKNNVGNEKLVRSCVLIYDEGFKDKWKNYVHGENDEGIVRLRTDKDLIGKKILLYYYKCSAYQ